MLSVWPVVPWRTEAVALDREKDVDVGERRPLVVVSAPALTQQVLQLPRTVGAGCGGGRWRRVSGQVLAVPATQRVDQLIVAQPLVRSTSRRRHHLPHGDSERPYVALRRQPSLNSATTTTRSRRRQSSPPVPPSSEHVETYASSLILAYLVHYMKTWRHTKYRKYTTYRISVRGGPCNGHR